MMKLQRRYRAELNPTGSRKQLPVAHSMRILQPAKKLKKSPKLEKVDLVADIESAYGKAFGTDVLPCEKSMEQHPCSTTVISIGQELTGNAVAATSSVQSYTTAPSSSLVKRKKKNSEVLAKIKNELNKKSKKVNKLTR